MQAIPVILLLFIAVSCNKSADFYIGTWELNKENGISTLTISENKTLSWDIRGFRFFEYPDFKAVMLSPEKYDIIAGQDKECSKFTMEKLSDHQCICCDYKCYIDENMIDEVFIFRKNQHPQEPIEKPDKEIIILPKDYEGNFYIVYQYSSDSQSKKIKINDKGIGINQGAPELRQLFNANRSFRFEGQEKDITIANPDDYMECINPKLDSNFKDEEVIVIQKGINQSGRTEWNEEHGEEVRENLNIEHFEVRWMNK